MVLWILSLVNFELLVSRYGRTLDDSLLPGYGNPAASVKVKSYLKSVREEQFQAHTRPSQAERCS